jgi:hypothetical protein
MSSVYGALSGVFFGLGLDFLVLLLIFKAKVPVYLYFLMISFAVDGFMESFLAALAIEKSLVRTSSTSFWRF